MKYRRIVPTEAERFEGIAIWRATKAPLWNAAICECRVVYAEPGGGGSPLDYPHIHTLEGIHRVNNGDWIARGIKGEFWPIEPDIFAATYEPVDDPESPAPLDPPHRARCDGCRLTWGVDRPFPDEMHGKPHEGCRFAGHWVISASEAQKHINAAKEAVESKEPFAMGKAWVAATPSSNVALTPEILARNDQRMERALDDLRSEMPAATPKVCERCGGSGRGWIRRWPDADTCPDCGGTGHAPSEER